MIFYLIKMYGSFGSHINTYISKEIPKIKTLNKFKFSRTNIQIIKEFFND